MVPDNVVDVHSMALPAYAVSWRQDDSAPVAKTSPTCYRRPTGSSERCELTVPLPPGASGGVRLVLYK
ncbi:hypothetical protein C2E20_3658 [Micractinium conductrix]|uniref:Uncharacterized protein n=1 Tax=Micractinium conductrix TaxID=554055 RepID=A0A2P6VG11_9CHLO|nr:hypothetical protein C2E20_3658 [Micractinium conductrix]|eukprot:PSC73009.1 hypothetical protein C2E20_3658 [Micractinium conductrix]